MASGWATALRSDLALVLGSDQVSVLVSRSGPA